MSKKLYVGNLPYSCDQDALAQMFADFGTVESAKVVTDFATGRSKGFGFVEMSSPEEAQKGIQELDGKEWGGRAIRVSEARQDQGGRRSGGFNKGRDRDRDSY